MTAVTSLPALDYAPPRAERRVGRQRLAFLDGLRGFAALAVVVVHMGPLGPFANLLASHLPATLMAVGAKGFLGVEIFFVLSGFVMAMSLRDVRVTPAFFGNFAMRRWLRLDPPYLITIALVVGLNFLSQRYLHAHDHPVPPLGDLIAHVFYVPVFAGRPFILDVFWTLCLEVQFYIVLVLLIGLSQRLPGAGRKLLGWSFGSRMFVFAPLALLSLADWLGWLRAAHLWLHLPTHGFFLYHWYMFFLGVIVYWTLAKEVHIGWLMGMVLATLSTLIWRPSDELAMAVTTAAAIHIVGFLGGLESWLDFAWLQFFGRISYSLYLVHNVIGTRVLTVGQRFTHDRPGFAVLWLVTGFLASIAAAWLMYRFVERPGVELGKRLKRRTSQADVAIAAPAPGIAP